MNSRFEIAAMNLRTFGTFLSMNLFRVAASRQSAAIVETQSAALSRDAATLRFMGSKREFSFKGRRRRTVLEPGCKGEESVAMKMIESQGGSSAHK